MNKLIFLTFFLIHFRIFAQVNYDEIKSKIFYSADIDTINESVLIVEKKFAILIFKQSELDSIIRATGNSAELGSFRSFERHDNLVSLLRENHQKISLTDYWFDYTDTDRKEMFGHSNYSNPDKAILENLIFIGGDLILGGKVMIIEREEKKIVKSKMKIERVEGLFGSRYVEFRLPNKKAFWRITTILGE
jgi:hypothetical protein